MQADGETPGTHVFDQTNGVVDGLDGQGSPRRAELRTPPRTFGVPPLTSL